MGGIQKTNACAIVLHEGCARNVPLELHYHTPDDVVQVFRTRMLDLDGRQLYLDSPQHDGKRTTLNRGRTVSAYLLLNGTRYAFRSRVLNTKCWVQLNNTMRVPGIAILRPKRVQEHQRREDYRVLLAGTDPLHVDLHEADADNPDVCPMTAARFSGRVIDLSRGGMCLCVERERRQRVVTGEYYFVNGVIPDGEGEIAMLVEVRHFGTIARTGAWRLGVRFTSWNRPFTKPFIHRVARYCAEVQRRCLRRTR